ncbi:hypothetical protein B0T18DRAFT_323155 [Schizothecium vesticola]|uniref:Transmembrane protein n=1 Tax=Schizothecium vesticola TaxID=314040 RepID=A0AA40K8F2_9PEZI|nr:hypothetical protein B0T18DRAFT_323155 [Schizothecium vesticola]
MAAINVDHVFFQRAKWRLQLLIPAWIFQIVVLLGLMGIFAYRVAETVDHYSESKQNGQIPMVEIVWESTNVAFSTLALVCTMTEIAKAAAETLTPFAMVCTHILKLTLALAMLALDIVVHIQGLDHEYSSVGLALDCAFLAVAILTLVYTILTYRRLLAYEAYQLPSADADAKRPPRPRDLELGNHVSITAPNAASPGEQRAGPEGDVVRRIGVDFGWSATATARARTGSLVGSGVVPRGKASPTPPPSAGELRRAQSFVPEIGRAEEEEDEEGYDVVRRGSGGVGRR